MSTRAVQCGTWTCGNKKRGCKERHLTSSSSSSVSSSTASGGGALLGAASSSSLGEAAPRSHAPTMAPRRMPGANLNSQPLFLSRYQGIVRT